MTAADGAFHDRYGASGMLYGEASLAVLAVVGFTIFARLTRRRRPPVAASPVR